ncbi:carotenoid ester lipase precursor [Irpex lacteus]|nr:carotenoid ester lipase precursor [Irpex lacteus]
MLTLLSLALSATLWSAVLGAVPARRSIPTATLDHGTFVGAASGNVSKFLGIPFAKPPTGDLRFRLPVPNDPYTGTHLATSFGNACPQQASTTNFPPQAASDVVKDMIAKFFAVPFTSGEDCLTLNVWTPNNVPHGTKLPVAVWIYGGGFESGATAIYDGGVIVNRSIELGSPVVYVSMNYRLSAFGFLAGAEVKEAGIGNLGLRDQRQALRWVQKYISAFNGDPTKVTIWGESAGAISAALHLVANNGDNEGLFRGAFSESGAPIPVGDITVGQPVYDAIVQQTGCSGSSDTLACLRKVPYPILKAASDQAPALLGHTGVDLGYLPRADGEFLTEPPQHLVRSGKVAKVPFVSGNNDDEGTLFTISLTNITTDAQVADLIQHSYLPAASEATVDEFLRLYPSDITAGSPYDTGTSNALTPQFKRLSSMQGDFVFQAPRRFFLQERSNKQATWSYLHKRYKTAPILGSFHATELLNVYSGGDLTDYIINFVNNLDPNGPTVTHWPKYNNSNPQLLTFLDGDTPRTITTDNYRVDQMNFVTNVSLRSPL